MTGIHPDLAERSAVELKDERGPWMKVQAGALRNASVGASSSSIRAWWKVIAMRDDR
ncbi:hypothetical protein SFHH103_03203 [Sinorhizobium fredii HH103]|uniref:Uncharacterized protein n=1 Tax=Sinorhizobium fredii (strain HH103) TaxID=1117943 RepID=G9A2D0_SINF1|nr:hypothetical protein SFHH103_03203 [Sinorhizobium fredii HH103]